MKKVIIVIIIVCNLHFCSLSGPVNLFAVNEIVFSKFGLDKVSTWYKGRVVSIVSKNVREVYFCDKTYLKMKVSALVDKVPIGGKEYSDNRLKNW
jgi:hypothetical protein